MMQRSKSELAKSAVLAAATLATMIGSVRTAVAGKRAFGVTNACARATGTLTWSKGHLAIESAAVAPKELTNHDATSTIYLSWNDSHGHHNVPMGTARADQSQVDINPPKQALTRNQSATSPARGPAIRVKNPKVSGMPHNAVVTICTARCRTPSAERAHLTTWDCGHPG